MSEEDQIAELKRQLADTRNSAVHLLMGMADAVATTPEGREDLARGFDEIVEQSDEETAYLAKKVAAELRARGDTG